MDDSEKFNRLVRILSEDGVRGLQFFCLKEFPGYGRGLCSLLSRQPGEELFRIPQKYIFTDYGIENHPQLSAVWKAHPQLLSALTANPQSEEGLYPFILHFFRAIMCPQSEFQRIWFSLFPRDLSGHSIAWSDRELRGCGNLCPIRRDTVEIQVWIQRTFKVLRPIIEEFGATVFGKDTVKLFNESMVEFLCTLCRNRGVLLPLGGGDTLSHCFVPLGDFGNHKFGAKASVHLERQNKERHLDKTSVHSFVKAHPALMTRKFFEFEVSELDEADQSGHGCLVVRAQEPIISGGQICYEYSAAPNWELIENFGFAVKFNPYDRVIVNVSFEDTTVTANDETKLTNDNKSDRVAKELKVLDQLGVSKFIQRKEGKYILAVALTLSQPLPQILLSANRIKLLSDQQLEQLTPRQIAFLDRVIATNKIGDDVNKLKVMELKVLRSLQASVNVLFDGYRKESLVDPKDKEITRKEVDVVYQSIRTILFKSLQLLEARVQDLAK